MGGFGSGRSWQGGRRAVEQCLVLATGDFHRRGRTRCNGSLHWAWGSGRKDSVGYFFTSACVPTLMLEYCYGEREVVRIPVRLQTTDTQFDGSRWWFSCPLIVDGVACNRRVGKLYLPPNAKYFGCRRCHNLTYRSCQRSHQTERLFALIGQVERSARSIKSRRR
jgi:hypothetical protein